MQINFDGFNSGESVTIAGTNVPTWGEAIPVGPSVIENALSMNLGSFNYYDTNQPFMNMIYGARFWTGNADNASDFDPDPTTRLPMQLPVLGGVQITSLQIGWDSGNWGDGHPMLGQRYVIRHNLDTLAPGQYSFTMNAGFSIVSTSTDEVIVDLSYTNRYIQFRIETPPNGTMPDDWTIEMVRQSDLPAYDNGAVSPLDASRIFTPEYLAMLARMSPDGGSGPGMIRFMKPSKTEQWLAEDIEEYTRPTDSYFAQDGQVWPLEYCAALCNHLQSACFITTPVAASDSLLSHIAETLAETLDDNLEVWAESGNELWNWFYRKIAYSNIAVTIKKFGTQGVQQGTVSITKGSSTITASGVDLRDVFGDGSTRANHIVVDNYMYDIDTSTITANSMQMADVSTNPAIKTVTNSEYYIPDKLSNGNDFLWREPGYTVRAVKMAQRFIEVFTERGERARLKTQLGGQLVNPGVISGHLSASYWRGQPDFVEPASVFDHMTLNTYYGSDLFREPNKTEARARLAVSQASFNDFVEQLVQGTASGFSCSRTLPRCASDLQDHQDIVTQYQQYGIKVSAYEGGTHIVHTGNISSSDTDIIDAMIAFYDSDNCGRITAGMCDNALNYTEAPVMQHRGDVGPVEGSRGHFPINNDYAEAPNQRLTGLVAFANANPIWW